MFQMKTARFPEVIKSRVNSLSRKKDTAKTRNANIMALTIITIVKIFLGK